MFGRLMPREGKYFDLFNAHAEQIVLGGQALVELIEALINKPELAGKAADDIDRFEVEADRLTHETMQLCIPRSSPRSTGTKFTN